MNLKTNSADAGTPAERVIQPFVEFWTAYAEQVRTHQGPTAEPSWDLDLRAWRRRWMDAVRQSVDAYLRSPAFLQAMKTSLQVVCRGTADAGELSRQLAETARQASAAEVSAAFRRLAAAHQQALDTSQQQAQVRMLLDAQQAMLDEARQIRQRFACSSEIDQAARRRAVERTPHEVVYEDGSLRLLRYRQERPLEFVEPILVCFALVNRPYILDLQPDRSVVRQLLARGFEVYLIDWGAPLDEDRRLRLYDYVCGYLKNVVDFVCEQAQTSQVNLLGYCMGGTMSTMFTTLYQQQVRNLILMATPIDFGGDAGLLNVWTKEDYFDVDALIDTCGNCPGELLQACFQLMKPVENLYEKYVTFFEKMDDDRFLENFFAMEQWTQDNIPVAGESFREFVKLLFQRNLLVQGAMHLEDVRVRLNRITCPLLLLVADYDHLVPPGSSLALRDHVRSTDVEQISIDAGHIGLAVSSRAHRELWPAAVEWIAAHSTERAGW